MTGVQTCAPSDLYYIGPVAIIVRAADSVEANQKAESKGVYFDGKNDCPCCGNRWSPVSEYDASDVPMVLSSEVVIPNIDEAYEQCISKVDYLGDCFIFNYKGEKLAYLP